MCDVIIITFEELKNIIQLKEKEINNLKDKLNHFEYDKNNFKTLIIDFIGNSPYQQNFIYFCHNFIGYNESFNKIALFNMGKKNFDINCYNKMKDREPQEPEIYFANLEILMIEVIKDDTMKFIYKNEIMEFIELFFYKDRMNYIFEVVCHSGSIKYFFIYDISEINRPLSNNIQFLEIDLETLIINFSNNNLTVMRNKSKKSKDILINKETIQKIKAIYNFFHKFYKNISTYLKGKDIINKINYYNLKNELDSKILTDKSQKDFLCKGLIEHIDVVLHLYKILDKTCKIIYKQLKEKSKKNCLLIIIKTKDENIFAAYKNFNEWIFFDIDNGIIFETEDIELQKECFFVNKPNSLSIKEQNCLFIKKKKFIIFYIESFFAKFKNI